MNKSKILYIHHGKIIGGAPKSLRYLIKGVSEQSDISIKVLCAHPEMKNFFKINQNIIVDTMSIYSLILGRIFIGLAKLTNLKTIIFFLLDILRSPYCIYNQINYFKKEQPDIIHLNSSILWTSAVAAKILNIPVVWHIRENFVPTKFGILAKFYGLFIKAMASHVICISPSEQKSINGQNCDHVTVIYNSIDFSSIDNGNSLMMDSLKKQFKITDSDFVFLSLGGCSFRKGTYQLIESMQYLDEKFKLIIAGSHFNNRKQIQYKKIKQFILKIENFLFHCKLTKHYSWFYNDRIKMSLTDKNLSQIHFTGAVDNVYPLIKHCDVLIFAGTTPHFARPIYEAWALKKPVAAFDTEVMRKEIDHKMDGILMQNHTGEQIAQTVLNLSKNPDYCKQLGEQGYKKSIERFHLSKNTKKLLAIYKELLVK